MRIVEQASSTWADKRFANLPERNSFRLVLQSGCKTFDGFIHRFMAEPEGLMMNWNQITRARGIREFHGLFGIAMIPNPRVIRADWHNCGVKRAARTEFRKKRCHSGIAAKENRFAFAP